MTTEDNGFLVKYNGQLPSTGALSDDDFERIMEVFEDTAAEQTPFASVDNTVVPYDVMVPALNQLGLPAILQHCKAVYEYWKSRRQEMSNKPLHPMLKFETHQESDDTDPYVCFRRREARQTRKTRGRDTKVTETLKRLRCELEDGRQLVLLAYEREMMKRELLHMDRAVFEERARLKHIKTRLGIKDTDDDLINQKVCAANSTSSQCDANLPISLRSAKLLKHLLRLALLVLTHGRPSVKKEGQLNKTLSCYQTDSQRKKTNCGLTSR